MEFFRRASGQPERLGILAGTFHPPTRAHLGIARAALETVDEVLFVLPREFPHKQYEQAGFDARMRLLLDATAGEPRFSAGASNQGLFIDIARECRRAYGSKPELWFLSGSDAADRIVNWNYGENAAFLQMLDEFGLLVAKRGVIYEPPANMRERIKRLALPEDYSDVSATEVRERIAKGEPWEHLVPEAIVDAVRRTYGRGNPGMSSEFTNDVDN